MVMNKRSGVGLAGIIIFSIIGILVLSSIILIQFVGADWTYSINNFDSDYCFGGVCGGNLSADNMSAVYGWFDYLCLSSDVCISTWSVGGGGSFALTVNANSTDYIDTNGSDIWFLTENLPAGGLSDVFGGWVNSSEQTNTSLEVNIDDNLIVTGEINASSFSGLLGCGNITGGSDTDYCTDADSSVVDTDTWNDTQSMQQVGNVTYFLITDNSTITDWIVDANNSQTTAELYNNSDEFNAIFFPALWSATTGNNTMLNLSMIDFAKNVNSSAIEVANASAFESAVNNITVADLDMRSNDINMLGGIGIGMTNDVNPIDILSSSSTGGIGWNSSVTNATLEQLRFTLRNYDSNNAQPFAYLGGVSDGTNNELRLGGGYGVNTAATSVKIYTGADYYTTTGTARLTIDNTGKSTFDGNLSFTGFWVTGAWSSLNSIGIGTDPSGTDPLSIITGSTGGILMQSVITNATSKEGRLKVGHYDTDLGTAIAFGMTNKPTASEMRWGGGYAANFAATDQIFYTGDDNYEFSGIERMHILPNGTTQFANGSITLEAGNLTIGDNGMDIKDMKGIGVPTNGMAFSSIAVPEAGLYFQNAGLNFTDKNGKTTFLIEYVAGAATGNVTVYADNSSAATCGAVKNGDNIDWACSVKGS